MKFFPDQTISSALQSDHKWLQAQLGLIITSSSALEYDHSLVKVWVMVWIWVWTIVWEWSDQNAFGLKGLIRILCAWKVWSEVTWVWKVWSGLISVWKVWSEIISVWKVWWDKNLGLDLNLANFDQAIKVDRIWVVFTALSVTGRELPISARKVDLPNLD